MTFATLQVAESMMYLQLIKGEKVTYSSKPFSIKRLIACLAQSESLYHLNCH